MEPRMSIVVGITGASGSVLALNTVDELLRRNIATAVVCSNSARLVWQDELGTTFNNTLVEWQENPNFSFYPANDMRAPIASGTYPAKAMVVVPASMNTIASIAHGITSHLVHRAADVCLKERRRLVLVPRETPLNSNHLENMLTLSRMGVVVLPPEPAFYLKPQSVDDIVRFVVSRIMVALDLDESLPEEFRYDEKEDDRL